MLKTYLFEDEFELEVGNVGLGLSTMNYKLKETAIDKLNKWLEQNNLSPENIINLTHNRFDEGYYTKNTIIVLANEKEPKQPKRILDKPKGF
jgi:hypothetical protein